MTVTVRHGYAWIADRDRVAHARQMRGRPTRTLCGLVAIDERYAHPAATRCSTCEEAATAKP